MSRIFKLPATVFLVDKQTRKLSYCGAIQVTSNIGFLYPVFRNFKQIYYFSSFFIGRHMRFFPVTFNLILLFSVCVLHAADINFSTPVTITGNASDISALGLSRYAYAWNGSTGAMEINGVMFNLVQSGGTIDGNITVTQNNYYGGTDQMSKDSVLPANYKKLVGGVVYRNYNQTDVVTLRDLTPDHFYLLQIWINDSRNSTRGTTVSGFTGNAVFLDHNSSNVKGGVGQFAIGKFVATDTTEQLTFTGANQYLNSLQLRDITNLGYWTGSINHMLDATTANFCTNNFDDALGFGTLAMATLSGGGKVTFADTYFDSNTMVPVTQTNITVTSGGVEATQLFFVNNAVNYELIGADETGICGASVLVKSGEG
jgi:hypothetical protein